MLTEISIDDFRDRYLLGRQVAHEGVRSFEARDAADQQVMVHLLGPVDGPEAVPWIAAVSALDPERRAGLLGAFQVEGEAVLVTELVPEVRSLADWFVSTSSRGDVAPRDSVVRDDGKQSASPAVPRDDTPASQTASDSAAMAHLSDASGEPGEFTRMFGHDKRADDIDAPTEPMEKYVPGADDSMKPEPQSVETDQAPSRQAEKEQGDFTRMFGSQQEDAYARPPQQPKQPEPAPQPDAPLVPEEKPEKERGEFTKLFGAGGAQDSGPRPSGTLAEHPRQEDAQRTDVAPPQPPAEEPRSGPRIVWRDKKSTDTPRKQPTKEPPAPPKPAKSKPPGQFTEIFGHELSSDSAPGAAPSPSELGSGHRKAEQPRRVEPPVPDTGPRKSIGDMNQPFSGQSSDDYLKALGSAPRAEPPAPPAPPPKPTTIESDYSPDLPPPVTTPRTDAAPGPSDYTRVVSGHPAVPPPTPAPAPSPSPAPAPSPAKESDQAGPTKVPTWLWVALVAIVLIMVLLIVIVVLT
jgi:hypothetical protein